MQCLNKEQPYAAAQWHDHSAQFEDILYHKTKDGIAKITINRPHVRNAFRPQTVKEMIQALSDARYDNAIGCIILTGQGEKAFCAGGDQKIRGDYGGYRDDNGVHHLNILDFSTPNSNLSKADCCYGCRLCDWRWTCITYDV